MQSLQGLPLEKLCARFLSFIFPCKCRRRCDFRLICSISSREDLKAAAAEVQNKTSSCGKNMCEIKEIKYKDELPQHL